MSKVAPKDYIENIYIPGLFVAGVKDKLVPSSKVEELYK